MPSVVLLIALALPSQAGDDGIVSRTYDVRHLVGPSRPSSPAEPWPSAGGLVLSTEYGYSLPEDWHPPESRWSSQSIANILTATLPEGDLGVEVSMDATKEEIAINARPDVHARFGAILEALGKSLGSPHVVLEVVVAPAGIPFVIAASRGRAAQVTTGSTLAVLADTEVNQTGSVPVINPVVDRHRLGWTVEVEPLLLESGDLRVTTRVTRLKAGGEPEVRKTHYADLRLQALEEESLSTVLLLQPGQAALAGSFTELREGSPARELSVMLRARSPTAAPVRPSPNADEAELLVQNLSFLVEPLPGEAEPVLDADLIAALIRSEVLPEAWTQEGALLIAVERFLVARASRDAIDATRKWLAARTERRARSAEARVEVLEGPWEAVLELRALAREGLELPEGWRASPAHGKLAVVFRADLRGLVGAQLRARGLRTRPFVRDIETSSGCGFSIIAAPDPVIERAGDGFVVEAVVREAVPPDHLELDLAFHEAATTLTEPLQVLAPLTKTLPGEDGSPPAGIVLRPAWLWIPYQIDLPRQTLLSYHQQSVLYNRKETILRIAPYSGGRGRIIVASARIVTGPREEEPPARMRAFDVSRLFAPDPPDASLPAKLLLHDEDGTLSGDEEPPMNSTRERELLWHLETVLPELVPADWSKGEVLPAGGRLAVRHSTGVLDEVSATLAALNARAARRFSVEAALVPLSALETAAPGAASGGSPWLESEALERAVRAGAATASYLAASVAAALPVKLAAPEREIYLVDTEVNQTGVVPIFSPVSQLRSRGVFLEVGVFPLPLGERARVEIRLGRALEESPPEKRRIHTGDVQLLREKRQELRATVTAPLGRTVVLGLLPEAAAEEPLVGLLRVRQLPLPAGAAENIQFIDVAALESLPDLMLRDRGSEKDNEPPRDAAFASSGDGAIRRILAPMNPDPRIAAGHGELAIRCTREQALTAARALEEMARPQTRPVQLELWLGSFDAADLDKTLDDQPAEATRKLLARSARRVRLLGTSGGAMYLDSLVLRGYLKMLEAISGGTGSTVFEVSDPMIAQFRQGVQIACRADLLPDGKQALLYLHGRVMGPPRFRKGTLRVAQGIPTQTRLDPKDAREPSAVMVEIDLPEADAWPFAHRVTVPLGRPVLLEAAPDAAALGRSRVLIALITAPD